MGPRLRRLKADADKVSAAFAQHPHIRVLGVEGNPPEKYTFEFRVTALVPQKEGPATPGVSHRAEVYLPADYPRRPPFARMITPVYHPNIDPQKICIGDHWSAGQSLVELVAQIAQMLCFQSYNIKSPLNAEAAVWAQANAARLPLFTANLMPT
jgi:ubiquitin-protein ligase